MKKIHKLGLFLSNDGAFYKSAICKVHNKTYAYQATIRWSKVDCANCLKKKRKK